MGFLGQFMNAPQILEEVFQLKLRLDSEPLENARDIQIEIEAQLQSLQCITKEPLQRLKRVINVRYPLWLAENHHRLRSPEI